MGPSILVNKFCDKTIIFDLLRGESLDEIERIVEFVLRVVDATSEAVAKGEGRFAPTSAYNHHGALLQSYLLSHRLRNHAIQTIQKERSFLMGWFQEQGSTTLELFTWQAMAPHTGRERLLTYAKALHDAQLTADTIRSYLGILRKYFAFVLEHPYVKVGTEYIRIRDVYGPIEQPISEYDMPTHVYDGERKGVPFDPELLYDFYTIIRKHYLETPGHAKAVAARNYTALVVAGESGLRADELLHLEISDLHFDSLKLQTRWAKGTRGSGKRARLTLFTPLAQDTTRLYLSHFRPQIMNASQTPFLFPSKTGGLLDYTTIQKAMTEMTAVARQNGFSIEPHMSWHWMRRFFATRFIERFPSKLSVLITLLGHMNPGTVHRYIRHSQAWMDSQIRETLQGAKQWPSIGN